MRQAVGDVPDMSNIQPKQRKMAAGKGNADDDEDAGWGNTASLLDWDKEIY